MDVSLNVWLTVHDVIAHVCAVPRSFAADTHLKS